MRGDRNEDEATATMVRSSIMLPSWMDAHLEAMARRTFSSKAQVIRRMVAEGLEREGATDGQAVAS